MWYYIYMWVYMVIWIYLIIKGLLSCLRRVCQGSTNVSFQRSVLCVQERVQNASCIFFLEMVPKKRFFQNYMPTIAAVKTWCDSETSWLIAQGWWKIWKPGENLVNFQNLGELLVILKTWWKPGENLVNLQNRAMNAKTWWKLGENPVKSWWVHQVFTKQTKEAFYALKDSDKTLVASHTRNSIVKTFVAFQN